MEFGYLVRGLSLPPSYPPATFGSFPPSADGGNGGMAHAGLSLRLCVVLAKPIQEQSRALRSNAMRGQGGVFWDDT